MTYVVTVDTRIPDGAPEMDALHRVGATALLQEGIESVEAIEGPDGIEVHIVDSIVAVYPGGAFLKIFVDASTLEFAENAIGSVVEELLERSELLSEWTVASCEVQLHPELVKESLEAADGPDGPPEDLAARRARLSGNAGDETTIDPEKVAAENKAVEIRIRALAPRLKAFPPEMFGAPTEEELEDKPDAADFGTSPEDAELAAGALVWAIDVLLDELFQDVHTLTQARTNVAECEALLWHLDDLPERYSLQYDAKFARSFLVTTVAMTTRFTQGTFQSLSCLAEELALRLLLSSAKVTLETFDLLDEGVSSALECFADVVYEDMDHEWLYDDAMDGIDEDPAAASLGIAPMGIKSWFVAFNEDRFVHPYAADDGDDAEPEGRG